MATGFEKPKPFDYAISEAHKIPVPAEHFSQEAYDEFLKIDADNKKLSDCVANQIKIHGWLAHGAQRDIWAKYKGYGDTCFDIIGSVAPLAADKMSMGVIALDMVDCKFDTDHPMLDTSGNFDQRDTSGDQMTCRDRTISHWRLANGAAKYRAETPN